MRFVETLLKIERRDHEGREYNIKYKVRVLDETKFATR